ncbi:MFS multidrug transporter [Seiridium cupressi]
MAVHFKEQVYNAAPLSDDEDLLVEEPQEEWKPSGHELLIIITLGVINLLVALDASIIVTSLGAMVTDLKANTTAGFWIGTSYLLVNAVTMPVIASVSEIFGRPACLEFALFCFTVGTIFCCTATSVPLMLVGRCIQGIGGGGVHLLSGVIMTDLVPLRYRPKWYGAVLGAWALGTCIGPLIGGSFLLIGSATSFLIAICWGGTEQPWNSAATIAPLVLGLIGLGATLVWEFNFVKEPIFKRELFHNTSSTITYICGGTQGFLMWGSFYYFPFYFLSVMQTSAITAGVNLLPSALITVPGSIITGRLVTRYNNYRYFVWVGWAIATLNTILAVLWKFVNVTTAVWAVTFIIFGLGQGMILNSQQFATQAMCRPGDEGHAASMYLFLRQFGAVIGVGVGGSVFQNVMAIKLGWEGLDTQVANEAESYVLIPHSMPDGDPTKEKFLDAYRYGFGGVFDVYLGVAAVALILSLVFIKHYSLDREIGSEHVLGESRTSKLLVGNSRVNSAVSSKITSAAPSRWSSSTQVNWDPATEVEMTPLDHTNYHRDRVEDVAATREQSLSLNFSSGTEYSAVDNGYNPGRYPAYSSSQRPGVTSAQTPGRTAVLTTVYGVGGRDLIVTIASPDSIVRLYDAGTLDLVDGLLKKVLGAWSALCSWSSAESGEQYVYLFGKGQGVQFLLRSTDDVGFELIEVQTFDTLVEASSCAISLTTERVYFSGDDNPTVYTFAALESTATPDIGVLGEADEDVTGLAVYIGLREDYLIVAQTDVVEIYDTAFALLGTLAMTGDDDIEIQGLGVYQASTALSRWCTRMGRPSLWLQGCQRCRGDRFIWGRWRRSDYLDHPTDKTKSKIITTIKSEEGAGLAVFYLNGAIAQTISAGKPDSVDIIYGFQAGNRTVDLAYAACRDDNTPWQTGIQYIFVNAKAAEYLQYELTWANGSLQTTLVRNFTGGSGGQVEGCVADEGNGWIFIGEEPKALWRYSAEPNDTSYGFLIDQVNSGYMWADIEGVTLVEGASASQAFVLVSQQGVSAYNVYRRTAPREYVLTFTIAANEEKGIDAVSNTDGIEAVGENLGEDFPYCIFVTHDDANETPEGGTSNQASCKIVSLTDILAGHGVAQ